RQLSPVHPKSVDVNTMNRQCVASNTGQTTERFAFGRATHRELAAGNPDHIWGGEAAWLSIVGYSRSKRRRSAVGSRNSHDRELARQSGPVRTAVDGHPPDDQPDQQNQHNTNYPNCAVAANIGSNFRSA